MTPAPTGWGGPERLHQLVTEAAAGGSAGTEAVTDGTGSLTFAALAESVDRLAAELAPPGGPVRQGDRVAVVADNCVAWIELLYATSRAGLVLAPVNQRLRPDEQADLIEAAGATVLAGQDDYLAPLLERRAGGRLGSVQGVLPMPDTGAFAPSAAVTPPGAIAGRDPAATDPGPSARHLGIHPDLAWLLFTSGTTGTPKGVQLTHAGLLAAARATLPQRPLRPTDVFLTCFPLCHVAAYNVLIAHLARRPVVLRARFRTEDAVQAIHRHGVTMASVAPTMLSSLLEHLHDHPEQRPLLSGLRAAAYGSSAIPPTLLRRLAEEWPLDLYQGYGMTEASGNVAFLGPEDHRRALSDAPQLIASCGKPSPAVELVILNETGAPVPLGQPGEIAVRGPQMTPGYWPVRSEQADDGLADPSVRWFRTGDVGRLDEDGYLYIVDRKRDIVVSGGENISSRQVEEALLLVPGVRAAAVVGVPDDHWGEAVCACVELAPGAELDGPGIRHAVRAHLAPFQVPKHVLVVGELPRNATGKVLKPELRRRAATAFRPATA